MSEADPMMVSTKDGKYYETRQFCCCFPYKCGIIFMIIILKIVFYYQIIECYFVFDNDYFDISYGIVYVLILLVYLVAAVLTTVYIACDDSPGTRSLLTLAFLLAAIAELLIALWVIIYITAIYDKDYV